MIIFFAIFALLMLCMLYCGYQIHKSFERDFKACHRHLDEICKLQDEIHKGRMRQLTGRAGREGG